MLISLALDPSVVEARSVLQSKVRFGREFCCCCAVMKVGSSSIRIDNISRRSGITVVVENID